MIKKLADKIKQFYSQGYSKFKVSDSSILVENIAIKNKELARAKDEEFLASLELIRKEREQQNREFKLTGYEVVKAIDLKIDDIIIHNYFKIRIVDCGCGFGAGNEFGDYFYVKGKYINSDRHIEQFWSYQRCPVVREIKS